MNNDKYIILADDDSDDRMLFEEAMKEISDNIKIISCMDGIQLMDILLEMNPLKPYIVFLDINMPKRNGIECLEQIRLSPTFKDIPVIMYSTCAQEDTVNKAFEGKANLYVKKPDNFGTLKNVLKKVLNINFDLKSYTTTRDNFIVAL